MPRVSQSAHPLARGSNARRRLLIARSRSQAPVEPVRLPTPVSTAARQPSPVIEASAGILAVRHILKSTQPATWVFTGDSITHGALYTEGWRCFPELFAERVRWELRRFLDVVINTGVVGERSSGLLKNLEQRVLRFRPEVAFLLIGMNDATSGPDGRTLFRKNLREIVGRVRESGSIPVLQTPNMVFFANSRTRADLPAYVDVIREIASRTETPLIDHWQHWQSSKPQAEQILPWLQDQSIHPNVYGHREMVKLVCRTLGVFDPSSFTCSLDVP